MTDSKNTDNNPNNIEQSNNSENDQVNKSENGSETSNNSDEEFDNTEDNISENDELNDQKEEDIRDEKFLELQARYDDLNDKYLRLFSEFDNFRKRTIKEKLELTKSASKDIIESLLPIVDDMERAVKVSCEDKENNIDVEGLNIILNKLKSVLRQKGVEEINSIGEDFNTDYHEAITYIDSEKKKDKGKVVDVVQKGYMINGKVIRFAKVVVAK